MIEIPCERYQNTMPPARWIEYWQAQMEQHTCSCCMAAAIGRGGYPAGCHRICHAREALQELMALSDAISWE